jgi:hypothetical protein
MREKRKYERERCFALALLPSMEAYGYIADISLEGLMVRIPGDSPEIREGKHLMTISCEELAIPAFSLEAEHRWSREEVKSTLVGFRIVDCADADGRRHLASLIEHYRSTDRSDEGIVVT